MNQLPPTTRLALRLGIKTKKYHAFMETLEQQNKVNQRREAFLTQSRETVLKHYPESKPAYEIQDNALRFYADVLITTPTSLNTNRRNTLRAQAVALEAFDFLDHNQEVPAFKREGRAEEASTIRAEELRTLRHELYESFDENARVNPKLRFDAHARYAQWSSLFFTNEKDAMRRFPELAALGPLKKQATRYYSQWVREDKIDQAIKECLNRALKDLSRHIPLPNAEELKAEALSLRSSWIGTQSTLPNKKKNAYEYQGTEFMRQLLGRNGIQQGWWPYNPDLLEQTDRITQVDNEILKEQWITSFNTQPKEQVIQQFPKLEVLYHKHDAARTFYQEKMAAPYAEEAAKTLLLPDFDKLIKNEPLLAVSEIDSNIHERIMEQIKYQLQVTGKDTNLVESAKPFNQIIAGLTRLQEAQFTELNASNEAFLDDNTPVMVPQNPVIELPKQVITLEHIAQQIEQLKEQLIHEGLSTQPVDDLLKNQLSQRLPEKEQPLAHLEEGQSPFAPAQVLHLEPEKTISLASLRSTAPDLMINHLFQSSHLSKTVPGEAIKSQWDIKALTEGLNQHCERLVIEMMGEPVARDKNQLRYGRNKGSFIVTTHGSKQGLWFDHQTGEGGNLLQLIQREKNLSFKEALDEAGAYLNLTPQHTTRAVIDVRDLGEHLDEDKQKTVRYARQLANASQPIQGTLAQTYLERRGIDTRVCSESVRFIPSIKEPETGQFHPALLFVGKNLSGNVQGVQAVFLDQEGNKLNCKDPKRSYGIIKGSAIPLHVGGTIYALAEGGETGLSIASANKDLTVFASLGSMTNFSAMDLKPQSNTIIIFNDHDMPGSDAHLIMNRAADELLNKGFNVLRCQPKEINKDFNDVLQERQIEGVQHEMSQLTIHTLSAHEPQNTLSSRRGPQREKKFNVEQELEF
ncbi:toprim domain-containing protein [Legionella lytica]|uniref:Toprim domain-containing protein n=1 Tax=Legionella lytica TaxID=96232 RepID=A0ABW8DEL9_9GAMM